MGRREDTERMRRWRAKHPTASRDQMRVRRKDPKQLKAFRKQVNEYRRRTINAVIEIYGGKCACCGEANKMFLTLDHVKGGSGRSSRLVIMKNKKRRYRDNMRELVLVKRLGKPHADFQILCFNCNCGRQRNGGACPHKVGN